MPLFPPRDDERRQRFDCVRATIIFESIAAVKRYRLLLEPRRRRGIDASELPFSNDICLAAASTSVPTMNDTQSREIWMALMHPPSAIRSTSNSSVDFVCRLRTP